jgi:hypothetical protein
MNATATMAPADRAGGPQGESGPGAGGPQYMRALERANQVRLARASLKRRVALGETCVAAVILDCPWEADSMAVGDLLMSQRRWGQTRCRKFLAQLPMSEKKTIGSMTDRQRRSLAAMLTAVSECGESSEQTSELSASPYRAPATSRQAPTRDDRRAMAVGR